MNPNDSRERLSGSETTRPSSCQSCAGVPQVVQRIIEAIDILKITLPGESAGRSLGEHTKQYAFSLTHSDLRRPLLWVLESIGSITHETNEIHPTPSQTNSPLLEQRFSRIKRKLSPLDTDVEMIIPKSSLRSGRRPSAVELPAMTSGQDRQCNSLGVPCPPSYPILSTSQSISLNVKPAQASSGGNTLQLLSPISYPPYTLPPIAPISPGKATPSTHLPNLQHHISSGFLDSQLPRREYDDPLSALQQAQTRITILGRKCQACDAEIGSLTKERSILRARVESLESQLQEIQESREEAQRQSAMKGKQYVDIMAMAIKIQAQGDSDLQRWKVEKEKWEHERQSLARKLAVLQRKNEVHGRMRE